MSIRIGPTGNLIAFNCLVSIISRRVCPEQFSMWAATDIGTQTPSFGKDKTDSGGFLILIFL